MLALAVSADVHGHIIRGRATVRGMIISAMPTVPSTFASHVSVSGTIAFVVKSQGVVLIEELIVLELPFMELAFLDRIVSFTRGPHLG